MSKKYLIDIDLAKNSLLNAKVQNLASAPSTPTQGQIYYDTTLAKFGIYNGSSWDYMGTSTSTGDFSSNTSTSVDGEVVLFSGTGGKTGKRATGTGLAKLTSGVLSTATSGTDYAPATSGTGILKGDGSGGFSTATAGTDYYNPGGTDVAVDDGGTGASNASDARTNLGLVIGTDVLAPNGNGSALTGITQSQVANLTSDLALKAPLASPTFTGTVTVPTPTNATDAATKGYVDNAVQGLSWKQAVRVASTANITIASALTNGSTIDGITVATGDRVLLKNQTTASQNGIYIVVASGAASRATDANTSAEIDSMTVYVEQGTANADTVWTLTTDNPVLDTTSLTYAQINGGATPTASTSTAGKVQLATQAEAQAKTATDRALTPASVADFARKYTATIGDGTSTVIAVTHGLGSQYVAAQVYDATSNLQVECDITLTSSTQTTFTFATAPTTNQYRVVIVG